MPVVEIPEKNMVVEFPDDMSPEEIERSIYTDIYDQPVISQAPELSFVEKAKQTISDVFRKEEPRVGPLTEADREAFEPAPSKAKIETTQGIAPEEMAEIDKVAGKIPFTPTETPPAAVSSAREQLGMAPLPPISPSVVATPTEDQKVGLRRSIIPPEIKDKKTLAQYGAYVPYLGVKAIQGLLGPALPAFKALGADTETLLDTAARYWRQKIGKGIVIPDIGIGFDEKGKMRIEPREPVPFADILGMTAEVSGAVAGPVRAALGAGGLLAEKLSRYARPFYRTIVRGMIGGALLGEGKADETLQNMALFGIFEPVAYGIGIASKIKNSTNWRRMTIRERGLVLESFDDAIRLNPNVTEGEIIRKWNNPTWRDNAIKYRREAFEKRRFGEKQEIIDLTDIIKKQPKAKVAKVKEIKPKVAEEKIKIKPEPTVEEKPIAEFRGWQEQVPPKPPLALYNIIGGRLHKSTVTAKTLEKEGIDIPETPTAPEEKVEEVPTKEVKEEPAEEPKAPLDTMVAEAQRWKGAAVKADQLYPEADSKARLRHSNMTTKGDLDAYLMRKFGIDEATARDVSNELTRKDLKPDMAAEVEQFKDEPWGKAALAKIPSPEPPVAPPVKEKVEEVGKPIPPEEKAPEPAKYTIKEGQSFVTGEIATSVEPNDTLVIMAADVPKALRRQGIYTRLFEQLAKKAKKEYPEVKYIEGNIISEAARKARERYPSTIELTPKEEPPLLRTDIDDVIKGLMLEPKELPKPTPKVKEAWEMTKKEFLAKERKQYPDMPQEGYFADYPSEPLSEASNQVLSKESNYLYHYTPLESVKEISQYGRLGGKEKRALTGRSEYKMQKGVEYVYGLTESTPEFFDNAILRDSTYSGPWAVLRFKKSGKWIADPEFTDIEDAGLSWMKKGAISAKQIEVLTLDRWKSINEITWSEKPAHYVEVANAISEGKITSHPDYPELGKVEIKGIDYVAEVMDRGTNKSVTTEGIRKGSESAFYDWVKENKPLRGALTKWMVENKRHSTGVPTDDLRAFLKEKGYKGFIQDSFANYLETIKEKPTFPEPKVEKVKEPPEIEIKAKLAETKARQKRMRFAASQKHLVPWIAASGGVNEIELAGEVNTIIYRLKKGKKVLRRGVMQGFLNKTTGRTLDVIVEEANEAGFAVRDTDELLELIEKDLKGAETGDIRIRVGKITAELATEEEFIEGMRENAREELRNEGLSDQEIERTLTKGRNAARVIPKNKVRKTYEELVDELELSAKEKLEKLAKEQETFLEEASFELKPTEPTPEEDIAARKERGEIVSPARKMPDYLSLDAADISKVDYDYEGPGGTQRKIADTKYGTYIFHKIQGQWTLKETIPKKPKVVIPTEKIPVATKGEQVSFLPKQKGAQLGLEDLIEEKGKPLPQKEIERREVPAVSAIELKPVIKEASRRNIIKNIERKLSIPIRYGRFRQKALGIYKVKEQVVRIKKPGDVEIAVHEAGHHIDILMGFPKKMPKEITNLAYPGAKNKSVEGKAEFIRLYVTNQTKAKKEVPVFYEQFEQTLKEYPEIQDLLVKTRQLWEEWISASSVSKVHSVIQYGSEHKQRPTFNDIYTKLVDEFRPLQILSEKVAEKVKKRLAITEDPFLLAWLTRGWARKAEQYAKWGTFQLKPEGMKLTGPSLRQILEPIEKEGARESLDVYLLSKRAVHDKRILKGFEGILSKKDFEQSVKELEPTFENVAKELYNYSDNLLEYLVDGGRISQELANTIKKKNLFYVPFYRLIDGDPSLTGLSKTKYANLFNPIKKLKGSSRDIYSPTESLLYNTYAMINIAERNKIGETLIKISKLEGMGQFIEKLPVPVKPIKMNTIDALEIIAKSFKGIPSDKAIEFEALIDQLIGFKKTTDVILALEKNKKLLAEKGIEGIEDLIEEAGLKPEDVIKVADFLTTFRPDYNPRKGEVIFYERGKPQIFHLDKPLYDAVMALDADSFNMLVKIAAYPAKWLRAGATLSPEFLVRNPARDQMTAFIYSKYGYIPLYDLVRGIFHITKKTDLYQQYNASGAAHSALVSLDRDYLGLKLEKILAKRSRQLKNLIQHPLETMQIFSELTEEATRVGEFARTLKKEGGDLEALYKAGLAARDITLDFSRLGLKTRSMNAITAFWNAQIQGVDKMVREFKNHPGKTFAMSFLGITVPSLLLWLAQHDDPYYQEIPTWRRILFWNIITHKKDGTLNHIWSIPKPFELGILFGSVPEMALDWAKEKDPEAFKDTLRTLVESFYPGIVPTGLTPLFEWRADKNFFFDRPIVPRSKEDLEPVLQYGPYTSETVKLIAEGMNKVPELKKLASPAKIQNLILGYTGGVGRATLEAVDSVIKRLGIVDVPPEPSMTLADIPAIRAFTSRFPSANTRSIERFYKKYTDLKQRWESQKEKAGLRGWALKIERPAKLIEYEQIAKALSTARKVANLIYENKNLDSEQKRIAMDNIYFKMIDIARFGVGKPPSKPIETKPNSSLSLPSLSIYEEPEPKEQTTNEKARSLLNR